MTHTPGPWFSIATSNIGHNAVVDADGFTICSPSPMGAGNARLIAAAPDMLAALRDIAAATTGDDCETALAEIQGICARIIPQATGGAA
jgi:hypothetical protein